MSAPMLTAPRNQILIGDAREQMSRLPSASVDCVITSPPYFRQRDYGIDGQVGAEAHVDEWVRHLLGVCQEVARLLKPAGSLWLNLGDGYSRHLNEGVVQKSLLLGPQRLALALCADGWLLRNQVIWAKTNPMPSSIGDRLSCTYEVLYFLTRGPSYYFDLDAIREAPKLGHVLKPQKPQAAYPPRQAVPLSGNSPRIGLNTGLPKLKAAGHNSHPSGKNPGDVWRLSTASYRGAHFATFPVELVRRPLLATCPALICAACDRAWQRRPQRTSGRLLATGPLGPSCTCGAEARRGLALDPFMGSGTVALAAEQHQRDWLGIELNPAYAELAMDRLERWRAGNQPSTENQ